MPHQRQQQRLSALINQFTIRYQLLNENPDTASGALVQLWITKRTSGGTCLTTQGAPFAVLGWSSDALAMYRNYVSQYQPMVDSIGSKTRCPISRVFANLPPDDADNHAASPTGSDCSSSGTELERCAAAQLAGIHSTLLLAVHDAENAAQLAPVAVFELAQHELHADFSSAVTVLAEIAQECGFWIPVYDQAHPMSSTDVPLLPKSSTSSTGQSAAAQGVCSSSWLVVDAPPAQASDEQQHQQQQHTGRFRRPSVIYEEHLEYDQARPADAAYLVAPAGLVGGSFRHASLQPVWEAASGPLPQLHVPRQPLHSQLSLPKSAQQHQELHSGLWSETTSTPVQHNRHKSMPPQLPNSVQQHDNMYSGFADGIGSAMLPMQQRHKSMPPQLPHHVHWGTLQQQPVQQRLPWDMLQQQQQHYWEDSSNTRLPVWQQQQYGDEQFQSAGVLPYVRQDSRGASMPLPTLTRLTSNASSSGSERVRAIVTVGGTFRQTGTAGGWEYVGGVQKVVSLPRFAKHDQIMELLASKVLIDGGSCRESHIHVKYALPGAVGSFIELACDDDVLNMYEELDDYNTSTPGPPMRLQLYLDTSTGSSRGSGASDSSRLTVGFRSPWSGLMQLQPSTPTTQPSSSASGVAHAAAQLSLQRRTSSTGTVNLMPGAGSGGSAADMQARMLNAFCRANAKSAPLLDPVSMMHPHQVTAQAMWSGADAAAAAPQGDDAAQCDQLTLDHLIASIHTADNGLVQGSGRGKSEPNLAVVQLATAAAEEQAGAEPISGSFSIGGRIGAIGSISLKQQLQQQQDQQEQGQEQRQQLRRRSVSLPANGWRDPQMQELLDQLKVQVEVIMPSELHVVRFIGGGAFGEVYLAKWHGTEVAVKCLSPTLLTPRCSRTSSSSSSSAHNEAAAELMREASILAQMRHPNIVSVFGVVLPARHTGNTSTHESDEYAATYGACGSGATVSARLGSHVSGPAVVFEYMAAGSLQSAIRSGAEWLKSSMAKAKVMLDTARGLGYLHSKSMVHFDLKSANLLFTIKDRTPTVKVADFGLSKQRHQTYVTGVDSMRGTLPWIAPEIIKNPANVTEAADIYSYGVIMWELWTGKEPFEGVHLHALLHQLTLQGNLSLPVPGSPEWGDEPVPAEPAPGWCALMLRCWSADPAARPTSKQLTGELENIMAALRKIRK